MVADSFSPEHLYSTSVYVSVHFDYVRMHDLVQSSLVVLLVPSIKDRLIRN